MTDFEEALLGIIRPFVKEARSFMTIACILGGMVVAVLLLIGLNGINIAGG